MNNKLFNNNITNINKENLDFEKYKKSIKHDMINIFQLDSVEKKIPLESFLENSDHWSIHTYNVFKRALDISENIEDETWIKADKELLYIMSWMHDSGRFRLPIIKEEDTDKQIQAKKNKQIKSERNHGNYGVSQIKLGVKKLKEKHIEINKEDQEKIEDYIRNHDFINTRLDWTKYQEPKSLEWQITRLADRISVPIDEEIDRYRETWKRLNTAYFKPEISFDERVEFTFSNMWNYIKSWKFDEFTFFLALLSQSKEDFSHPTLANIYQKWASSKQKWIERMLEIAKEEWYSNTDIKTMEKLIHKYINHFWITF